MHGGRYVRKTLRRLAHLSGYRETLGRAARRTVCVFSSPVSGILESIPPLFARAGERATRTVPTSTFPSSPIIVGSREEF